MLIMAIFTRIFGRSGFYTGGENKDREMNVQFLR